MGKGAIKKRDSSQKKEKGVPRGEKKDCPRGEAESKGRKPEGRGLFVLYGVVLLGLCAIAMIALVSIGGPRLKNLYPVAPHVFAVLCVLPLALLALGLVGIVLPGFFSRAKVLQKPVLFTLRYLFPLADILARILRRDRDAMRRSFVEANNAFARERLSRWPGRKEKLLLLLPHCLQLSTCPHRISFRIENCKQCMQCPIGSLIDLARDFRTEIAVATGGRMARRLLEEHHPDLVLAVACEGDLTAGICDVLPLPVIGVVNERPQGPCRDTLVDIEVIRKTMEAVLDR
jgi:hypothetical protein